jgi:hypothetical protein
MTFLSDLRKIIFALSFSGFPDTLHTWNFIAPEVAKKGYWAVCVGLPGYLPSAVPDRSKMPSGVVTDEQTDKSVYAAPNVSADILATIRGLGAKNCTLVCFCFCSEK